jgi:hypothetical protein
MDANDIHRAAAAPVTARRAPEVGCAVPVPARRRRLDPSPQHAIGRINDQLTIEGHGGAQRWEEIFGSA